MYSLKHKVTYSEISADKHISIAQAVRYFQDTSTFQSEAVGDTIEELEKKQCAWLLSAWQLEVDRYPVFGEELTISTWPYDSKGILAYRNFEMKDADGNSISVLTLSGFTLIPRQECQEKSCRNMWKATVMGKNFQ